MRETLGMALIGGALVGTAFALANLEGPRPPTRTRVFSPAVAVASPPSADVRTPVARAAPTEVEVPSDEELLDRLWSEIDIARAQGAWCGAAVPAVAWSPGLDDAAQAQADWMVDADDWDHITPDNPAGATPDARAAWAGYDGVVVGEVIAWGQTTPRAAVRWWLQSPPHCRALLAPDAREVGMGLEVDPHTHGRVWVAVLGRT